MILYYALGGGLGHLTRARAVVHTLGLDEPVVFLSSSGWADDARVVGEWERLRVPAAVREGAPFRGWLQAEIGRLAPRALYVDAFPGGLRGELCGLELPHRLERVHVARLLRWEGYRCLLAGSFPAYDRTWVVEPLTPDHQRALELASRVVETLVLADPPWPTSPRLEPSSATGAGAAGEACGKSGQDPGLTGPPAAPPAKPWLVVHSGPEAETAELIAYAREVARLEGLAAPPLAVIAPSAATAIASDPESVAGRADGTPLRFDIFPAWPMFAGADRIFTACGFNAMRQAAPFCDRHRFLPFPRRFDDQFQRAARQRSAGMEGLAGAAGCRGLRP